MLYWGWGLIDKCNMTRHNVWNSSLNFVDCLSILSSHNDIYVLGGPILPTVNRLWVGLFFYFTLTIQKHLKHKILVLWSEPKTWYLGVFVKLFASRELCTTQCVQRSLVKIYSLIHKLFHIENLDQFLASFLNLVWPNRRMRRICFLETAIVSLENFLISLEHVRSSW